MHKIHTIIEYVDGDRIAHRFYGLTIPVIEFNEALPIIRELMLESFKHGKSFGQHLKAEDYVETIFNELREKTTHPRRQA